MAKIARLNLLPPRDKITVYTTLVPPSLFPRFGIDKESGANEKGENCLTVDAPEGGAEASVKLVRSTQDRDPLFYIEVSETRDLVQMSWDFIKINDPDSPRFDTDVTPDGKNRWLNWETRNLAEESKSMGYGLAPGQARRGMRLTGELMGCLDDFCRMTGFKSIALEALFYHNAIVYERHGFRYFQGEPVMRAINEDYLEGGRLHRLLNGSEYRRSGFERSIRGRSWAIHDGILEDAGFDAWRPPKMYRMVAKRFEVDTAPGIEY